MNGKLLKESPRLHPFDSVQQELFLNILRTADYLMRGLDDLLKPFTLSPPQYNILRLLRAAGESGLTCKHIGKHLITRDPDITRLLDRLEKRRLILRRRDTKDRRVVSTRITPEPSGAPWSIRDELYNYRSNPRGHVRVVATLDESLYRGGTMGKDHPITWCHPFEGGRAWYTGLGHDPAVYTDANFLTMLRRGLRYVAGRSNDC